MPRGISSGKLTFDEATSRNIWFCINGDRSSNQFKLNNGVLEKLPVVHFLGGDLKFQYSPVEYSSKIIKEEVVDVLPNFIPPPLHILMGAAHRPTSQLTVI
ncbi:unnamed protein product [Caenorhabditis nigoni]